MSEAESVKFGSNMLATIKPTALGKPKADLSLNVAKIAFKLLPVRDGEAKAPRQRANANVWPDWFDTMEAPKVLHFFLKSESEGIPVDYNEEKGLFVDEEGNEYTGDNVVEMADPDAREVSGTTDAIQNLQNAVTRFNAKTGKKLAIRFVKDQRDSSGRTIQATRAVIRVR